MDKFWEIFYWPSDILVKLLSRFESKPPEGPGKIGPASLLFALLFFVLFPFGFWLFLLLSILAIVGAVLG